MSPPTYTLLFTWVLRIVLHITIFTFGLFPISHILLPDCSPYYKFYLPIAPLIANCS